ncbi:hypothetical protein PBRA_006994 [Plasmodiophora brassicae]|uniref:SAC domain-containing protein n=1 Tax=Plasmodiophora brassicae TaxID=37360 RepID=A0A0G4IUD2_PLABS|nr:hypothetical protein PBRA_006994 [Plasmodiophora brassicae]
MRLYVLPDKFVVERDLDDPLGSNLHIQRGDGGAVAVADRLDPSLVLQAVSEHTFGVVGVLKLLRGRYLLHVSEARVVASMNSKPIYAVVRAKIIPFSSRRVEDDLPDHVVRNEEKVYLEMVEQVLSSSAFHFSYGYDLTHTVQRIAALNDTSMNLVGRADERFFWNRYLLSDYLSVNVDPCFIVLASGFFTSVRVDALDIVYALFSRRSCRNAGTRFTRRGVDHSAAAVNFAEQEQIIVKGATVSSFVQTRGSVPLLWSQMACLRWAPPVKIDHSAESLALCKRNLDEHATLYGRSILVNLVNQKGRELAIKNAFETGVPPYSPSSSHPYSLISFDFHNECKRMRYENIGKLVAEVRSEFDPMGFFLGTYAPKDNSWKVQKEQHGCFRTNCMDCLDRTNVVQSVFAERVLETQLRAVGASTVGLDGPLSHTFKVVWADNADALSLQYSGTGALKTDFTRTGKRSVTGALNDARNSITRYYLNNFCDGFRQDSIDLFLGNYRPDLKSVSNHEELPYADPSPNGGLRSVWQYVVSRSMMILMAALLATFGLPSESRPTLSSLIAVTLFIGPAVTLFAAHHDGRRFVDKPRFLPLAGAVFPGADDGAVDANKDKRQ